MAVLLTYGWAFKLPREKCDVMVAMSCCVTGQKRLSAKAEAIIHRKMV